MPGAFRSRMFTGVLSGITIHSCCIANIQAFLANYQRRRAKGTKGALGEPQGLDMSGSLQHRGDRDPAVLDWIQGPSSGGAGAAACGCWLLAALIRLLRMQVILVALGVLFLHVALGSSLQPTFLLGLVSRWFRRCQVKCHQ